jgi:phosphoglycerol transferase MdoB-like AlkP superfamily enzyme
MNPTPGPDGSQRTKRPLSEAAKTSLLKTHTLFRMFIVAVLGSFFVFQLDLNYLWLTAILTLAGIVLGIIVLVRAVRLKESRLVLFGAISGLAVSAVMALLVLVSAVFFNQVRDYQQCARYALTSQASNECRVQLENSMPGQLQPGR